jgi:hypothetical protein
MAGVYRPRHPERTVLYRVLSHHFDRFLAEYETRFEKEYGFSRPIIFTIPKMLRDYQSDTSGISSLIPLLDWLKVNKNRRKESTQI